MQLLVELAITISEFKKLKFGSRKIIGRWGVALGGKAKICNL